MQAQQLSSLFSLNQMLLFVCNALHACLGPATITTTKHDLKFNTFILLSAVLMQKTRVMGLQTLRFSGGH